MPTYSHPLPPPTPITLTCSLVGSGCPGPSLDSSRVFFPCSLSFVWQLEGLFWFFFLKAISSIFNSCEIQLHEQSRCSSLTPPPVCFPLFLAAYLCLVYGAQSSNLEPELGPYFLQKGFCIIHVSWICAYCTPLSLTLHWINPSHRDFKLWHLIFKRKVPSAWQSLRSSGEAVFH